MHRLFFLLVPLFMTFLVQAEEKLTGLQVMQKVDASNQGLIGSTSRMAMVLLDGRGNKVEREMTAKTIENKSSGDKSIMEFLKPMDVKGTKLLTWTVKDGDNQQWLYLPQFKRVKKINSRNQAGSFMGSEFSFEDIAGKQVDDYTYKLLEEDSKTWKVEATPKKSGAYSKIVSSVSKTYLNPVEVEYYDRRGDLLKTSKLSGYKAHAVGAKTFHLADQVRMDNLQTKKSSIITWKQRELGVKHRENDFKSNKLK